MGKSDEIQPRKDIELGEKNKRNKCYKGICHSDLFFVITAKYRFALVKISIYILTYCKDKDVNNKCFFF